MILKSFTTTQSNKSDPTKASANMRANMFADVPLIYRQHISKLTTNISAASHPTHQSKDWPTCATNVCHQHVTNTLANTMNNMSVGSGMITFTPLPPKKTL